MNGPAIAIHVGLFSVIGFAIAFLWTAAFFAPSPICWFAGCVAFGFSIVYVGMLWETWRTRNSFPWN